MSELLLGDALDALIDHRGKTPKKLGGEFTVSGVPVASAINVKSGRLDLPSDQRRVTYELFDRWMPIKLCRGDVLLTSEAPLGEVALVPSDDPLVLGQRLYALRGRPGVLDNRYLYYAFRYAPVHERLLARATGTTVLGIRQSQLVKVRIPDPGVRYQQAIGEVLGALDDKIALNERVSSRCEQLATALFDAEELPAFVELDELCLLEKSQVKPETLGGTIVAHYSLPAFDAGRNPDKCPAESIRSSKFMPREDVVLLSKLNPRFPRVWHLRWEPSPPALASTEFLVLRPRAGTTSEELWAACRQEMLLDEMKSRVTGTSGSHQRVKPEDALNMLTVDPREADHETRESVRLLVRRAETARKESFLLAQLRDKLLDKLMSGEIRVRDAERQVEEAV